MVLIPEQQINMVCIWLKALGINFWNETLTEVLAPEKLCGTGKTVLKNWSIYRFWTGYLKQLIFELRQGLCDN